MIAVEENQLSKKIQIFEIKADLVIKALGFDPEDLPKLFNEEKLQVSRWGTIKADFDTMETSIEGVFCSWRYSSWSIFSGLGYQRRKRCSNIN